MQLSILYAELLDQPYIIVNTKHFICVCVCFLQDIGDCPGPQSALMELNSEVKEKFNKLRLRIQVKSAADTYSNSVASDGFLD